MTLKLPPLTSIATTLTTLATVLLAAPGWTLPLSPGDRVRISIPADQTVPAPYHFSGIYEVNLDGNIYLPYIEPIPAAGFELQQVEAQLTTKLVQARMFQPQGLQVTAAIVQWSPIQVYVEGGAFTPGRILINANSTQGAEQELDPRPEPFTLSGDYPPGRYLTAALRSAGGLRPTADVKNIRLVRGDQEITIDLSGVFTGTPVNDMPLIAGDRVVVPQLNQLQNELVRPSQITPSAIAVFLSNQATPNSDGGGGEVAQFPYGARFSQAVVAARCAGGTRSTNANRRVTLVQTDRISGETQVYDRKVEDLLRNPNDNAINPFLMPEDSVICYDSDVTNVNGVLDFVGNILNPFRLIQSIFFGN